MDLLGLLDRFGGCDGSGMSGGSLWPCWCVATGCLLGLWVKIGLVGVFFLVALMGLVTLVSLFKAWLAFGVWRAFWGA